LIQTSKAMTFNSSLQPTSAGDSELSSYVDVACLTFLTYDTLLSAGQEYKYMWKSKWSVIKVLYICARYGTFIDTSMDVHERVSNVGSSSCRLASGFAIFFAGIGMAVIEIILMIRTYAQYNRSKRLLAFFLLLWCFAASFIAWTAFQWTKSSTINSLSSLTSCNLTLEPSTLAVRFYAVMLGMETITVFLTLWKGFHTGFFRYRSQHQTSLATTFYRDGIAFYLIMLFALNTAAVIQFVAPTPLQGLGETPTRVIHSIAACHLIIHVREVAETDNEDNTSRHTTSGLEFASPSAVRESHQETQ